MSSFSIPGAVTRTTPRLSRSKSGGSGDGEPKDTVLALDPGRVFLGIFGEHEGLICIDEGNGVKRPAPRTESNLALLTLPLVRAWAKDGFVRMPS